MQRWEVLGPGLSEGCPEELGFGSIVTSRRPALVLPAPKEITAANKTHRPPPHLTSRVTPAKMNGSVASCYRVCVPKTSSKSCDQAIFVDQATGASLSSDAVPLKIDRFGQRFQRRGAVQGPVRPVLVVVGLVLAQDPPQMVLVPDEGAV